jgi:hypothetical protein
MPGVGTNPINKRAPQLAEHRIDVSQPVAGDANPPAVVEIERDGVGVIMYRYYMIMYSFGVSSSVLIPWRAIQGEPSPCQKEIGA